MGSASLLRRVRILEQKMAQGRGGQVVYVIGDFKPEECISSPVPAGAKILFLDLQFLADPSPLVGAPLLPTCVPGHAADEVIRDLACKNFIEVKEECDW